MFRIAIAHKDDDHPNASPFAWRRTFDSADEARAALSEAKREYPAREYHHEIQQLVLDPEGESAEWKVAS